ncbi:MAG: pilus assembly protein PilZ [Geobacteraceae bacterium GWC2_58_44]|nr:MAG: pilus assembly protein PilZ [Geobacteraceae bacterium GWC2_58_44]HBG07570.1 PilZ domain-containing protein [Geobacter sp.]
MNDMYQTIKLAGEKEDGAQIIAILAAIREGRLKNDLKLLNFFREIPVSYGASVESVEENFAELLVHQIQAVVISFEKVTVLKSSHFPKDVIANANYVNIEKSRIVLSSFSYAIVRADRRMSVRVELSEPIYASFTASGQTAGGRLHDMSLTGISINIPEEPGFTLSENGELAVTLPIGTITVPASLLKVLTVDDGFRMVFEIEATRATELSISKYILQRQVEIIRELKDHPGINLG